MILQGDCIERMREMDEASVDAIVCDPPYGLGFMGKQWDSTFEAADMPMRRSGAQDAVNAGAARQGGRQRQGSDYQRRMARDSRAFQEWSQEWATEALRILKPGAHLLAFGGTRTYHRLACAIEDAGFEIRDSLIWIYGSGFPKSLDVSKAIDKAAGVEREERLDPRWAERYPNGPKGNTETQTIYGSGDGLPRRDEPITTSDPATPEARQWEGWGTALKPAHEPIVVARKPLSGTVAQNVLEHGTGALNVDGCRVGFQSEADERESKDKNRHEDFGSGARENAVYGKDNRARGEHGNYDATGRWPANITLSPEAAEELDRQSGERPSAGGAAFRGKLGYGGSVGANRDGGEELGYGDTGGASRFFLTVTLDKVCALCGLPCVPTAGNPSKPTEPASGSAPVDAQDLPPPESVDSPASSDTNVSGAGQSSTTTPSIDTANTSTAPCDAAASPPEPSDPAASDAESLCDACTTAIAQSDAATSRSREDSASPEGSTPGRPSTPSPSEPTPTPSPASIAEGQGNTDTTSSTTTPPSSSGSAPDATPPDTLSECLVSRPDQTRFRYSSKASRAERNAGLDGFEDDAREGQSAWAGVCNVCGCRMMLHGKPTCGHDDFEWVTGKPTKNGHPTVKPIDLMRWLVRLVTPPGGTALDPFTGSGTTGCAATLEGFDFIGIEREAEYVAIAEARIAWWSQFPAGTPTDRALGVETVDRAHRESGQGSLLEDVA